jgi:hypothetical protein
VKGVRDRYVIVDLGGETMLIDVAAPADKFDELLPKAHKVLDSVEEASKCSPPAQRIKDNSGLPKCSQDKLPRKPISGTSPY